MRDALDRELAKARSGIAELCDIVLQESHTALDALRRRSVEAAFAVREQDKTADIKRYQLENTCLVALATQQPVARDLRELLAASIIATELERCGDYAKGVARATRRILKSVQDFSLFSLEEMERLATEMLQHSVQAFLNSDAATARQVLAEDAKLDSLYSSMLSDVLSSMTRNVTPIEAGIWLLHAAHCLERIGDRATNIAERTLFVTSGEPLADLN
ncbi:MAG: phosphate signaling complex protein PhoU [Thermoflexales bacterium]